MNDKNFVNNLMYDVSTPRKKNWQYTLLCKNLLYFYNLKNFAKFIDFVDSSVLLGVVLSNAVL